METEVNSFSIFPPEEILYNRLSFFATGFRPKASPEPEPAGGKTGAEPGSHPAINLMAGWLS
jgi:hypothetical protein